jgi:hypothetical protein
MWPIAVIITPVIVGAGILWLKTQFPTKGELTAHEREVQTDLKKHTDRFEAGSRKFAEHDKRLALVEEECKSVPTRQSLQGELSQLSQRMRGVEVGFESVGRQLGTTNDYLKIIVDKGLKS